jgi:hypothetical protein
MYVYKILFWGNDKVCTDETDAIYCVAGTSNLMNCIVVHSDLMFIDQNTYLLFTNGI